jgi:hypothetical protein
MSAINMEIIPVSTEASLPAAYEERRGKTGKLTAKVYAFAGKYSAKALKDSLVTQGYKLSEANKLVKAALKDEAANRRVVCGAAVAHLANQGFVAADLTLRKNTASISFIKAEDSESEKAVAARAAEAAKSERVESIKRAARDAGLSDATTALMVAAVS